MAKHADATGGQMNGLGDADASFTAENEQASTDQREAGEHVEDNAETPDPKRPSSVRPVVAAGAAMVAALGCLAGWWGYRAYETHQAQALRNELVAVARQGALNLTTIDYTHVDTDVQRILDSSIGTLNEDFRKRSQPFVDVVKKAESKSEGTITAAGLESQDGDQAQVLVAVMVKTSSAGAPEQDPRRWRMRISVQKVGDQAKVSNVQFVP